MKITSAEFLKSVYRIEELPKRRLPEVAFFGRSNVGKSSLINCLIGKKIAHTSRTPGKTQCLNYYLINNQFYFVDAPGYGYAKISDEMRNQWNTLMHQWMNLRHAPRIYVHIIDASIPVQQSDLDFFEWLRKFDENIIIAFNKIDKIKTRDLKKTITDLTSFYKSKHSVHITFSSKTKTGKKELLKVVEEQLLRNPNCV